MIVLTGGAGFIGSNLLKDLNDRGYDGILIVDSLGSSEKWKNLVGKKFIDYCDKHEFLKRLENNQGLPSKVSAVLHLGACSSTMERDAHYVMANNFNFSKLLCEHSLHWGARFIYASSAATYGNGEYGFSDDLENAHQLQPLNIYAYSKLLFDQWVLQSGLIAQVVGLRFFNVFGPNEYHKDQMRSVVLKSFEQILATGAVDLFRSYRTEYRDGEQKRDFVYVKDCTDAMCKLLEQTDIHGIFNIGSGTARTWLDLVRAVFASMEREENIKFIDMPESLKPKYQYFTEAPIERLRGALPTWQARSLESGVSEYVKDYLLKDMHHR